ncbi:MAG TPA: hypothetical protein VG871_09605 [Vicinamibacterales bacterium]|nr:hypothetical protein [Vicinamibacterales bacterium]
MRQWLVVVAIGAAGASVASAQTPPDLSGTWIVDQAKSDPAPQAVGRGRGNPNVMAIMKDANTLTVSVGGADYIYNLDGSERTGPPGGETKSKIAWDGGTLVVTWKREYFAGPDKGYLTSTGRDTYRLAGNVLTVERMTNAPPQPPQTRKTVYTKAP